MGECVREGMAATARKHNGQRGNNFGPSKKDVERWRQRQATLARCESIRASNEEVAFAKLLDDAVANNWSVEETTIVATVLVREAQNLRWLGERKLTRLRLLSMRRLTHHKFGR